MTQNLIGAKIGNRYTITRLLGEGGMAEVYEAEQPRLNRKVAVKLLHRHLSSDEQFRARFEREAQAIAQLKHPHIIQVYDFDYDEHLRQFYMVIEYVDGPTLSHVLRKHPDAPIPIPQTLQIIEDLTGALGYAHSQHMQHRDIKPSNIMLDKNTRTVLTDFGIAKLLRTSGQQLTASGAMVGTPAYISPEQAAGATGDHRSDIYSLGIVFFQMATGRLPYEGETPIATILKHIKEAPPSPTSLNANLPLGVETVILRCIAKDPDDRYQSTDELMAHLRNLDAAAAEVDNSRHLSGKILSDNIFSTRATAGTSSNFTTPASARTPTVMPSDTVTDTLTIAPRKTSLLIGAGAIAIIALLTLGAFLFSTAGSGDKKAKPTENACIITLEADLFARSEPNESVTAAIPFEAPVEVRVIQQSGDFWLVQSNETEGWIARSMLDVPVACSMADQP
jgi:serine/threonine protein kinase